MYGNFKNKMCTVKGKFRNKKRYGANKYTFKQ